MITRAAIRHTSANVLTQHALRILALKGYCVWRNNTVGIWDPTKKIYRKNSTKKGVSDIIGFHRHTGRFCAIEIKAGKDRLSEEQAAFLELVKTSGGVSLVVRNSEDLEKIIKSEL